MATASNTDGIKSLLGELHQEMNTLQNFLKGYDCKEIWKVFSKIECNVHSLIDKICMLKNDKEEFISNIKKKLMELINLMKEANKTKEEFQDHVKWRLQSIMKAANGVAETVVDFNNRIRKKMDSLNQEMELASQAEESDEGTQEITAMISSLKFLIKKNKDF